MTLLDLSVILIQIFLPLALLAWLMFAPARSALGFTVHVMAVGLALLTLALIAMWLIPPWWVPYGYGLLWVLAVVKRLTRQGLRFDSILPVRPRGWFEAAVLLLLSGYWVVLIADGLAGRQPPPGPVAELASPLGAGTYFVAHGGANELINGHAALLTPTTERQRDYRGQSYAVDLVKIDRLGLRADGWRPRDPARYAIFGEPVLAPCDGEIVVAHDGMVDMPVPEMDKTRLAGNHVMIACDDVWVLLAHFRQGSVEVAAGDSVSVGDRLGEIGNSGNTTEPHLHIHAQSPGTPDAPMSGNPVPLTFGDWYPVRNERASIPKP